MDPIPLTDEQVAAFTLNGFLVIPHFAVPGEVSVLRGTLLDLFARRAGWEEGRQFGMVDADDSQGSTLRQIIDPANYAAHLRRLDLVAKCRLVARQLLGKGAECLFSSGILKVAHVGAATPWHQDDAYVTRPDDTPKLTIWIALQDTTVENGCMHYLAGHVGRPVVPHRPFDDDPRIHSLDCSAAIEPSGAVQCPVPSGWAIVHHARTPHYAGPNGSAEDRVAYAVSYSLPMPGHARLRDYPWHRDRRAASAHRYARWLRSGGILQVIARRIANRQPVSSMRLFLRTVHLLGRRDAGD